VNRRVFGARQNECGVNAAVTVDVRQNECRVDAAVTVDGNTAYVVYDDGAWIAGHSVSFQIYCVSEK